MCLNGGNNPKKSDQHPTKICPETLKMWSRGVLGPFWVADCPKDASSGKGVMVLDEILVEKVVQRVAFCKFLKIKNGTKDNFFSKDRHRDPQKTVPGSGFEKT